MYDPIIFTEIIERIGEELVFILSHSIDPNFLNLLGADPKMFVLMSSLRKEEDIFDVT